METGTIKTAAIKPRYRGNVTSVNDLLKGKATICIINYKTLSLTKLCLRSIRKFTKYPHEVLVVDNGSEDESVEYLRSLNWIHLIERKPADNERGGCAHAVALDVGLARCNTEFFVSMHSDVIVQRQNWLTDLIAYFGNGDDIACVGSGKIELRSKWRHALKKATDYRSFKRRLLREPDRLGKYRYYNRTICCLYRTDVLKDESLSFGMDQDKGLTSGKKLYFELIDRGYKTIELPCSVMSEYIIHLAHATMVVNSQEFSLRRRTISKYNRLLNKILSSPLIGDLTSDASLDC